MPKTKYHLIKGRALLHFVIVSPRILACPCIITLRIGNYGQKQPYYGSNMN